MLFTCNSCGKNYEIDPAARIKGRQASVKCAACGNHFIVQKPEEASTRKAGGKTGENKKTDSRSNRRGAGTAAGGSPEQDLSRLEVLDLSSLGEDEEVDDYWPMFGPGDEEPEEEPEPEPEPEPEFGEPSVLLDLSRLEEAIDPDSSSRRSAGEQEKQPGRTGGAIGIFTPAGHVPHPAVC